MWANGEDSFCFNIFDLFTFFRKLLITNMNFKIDTKEKMHVIMVNEDYLTANMAEKLEKICKSFLGQTIQNVIINLTKVSKIDKVVAKTFVNIQQSFAEKNASLVYCHLTGDINDTLVNEEVEEMLNITPTESEAWDIVQMEEIEREYLE